MKGKHSIFLIILTVLLMLPAAAAYAQTVNGNQTSPDAPTRSWNPARTWVYFVGLLEWKDKEKFVSFPQKNRRDEILLNVLRQSGVPENQIVYLKDSAATIAKVKDTFPKFLSQAKAGDTVIVYFCGHGYRSADNRTTYFATYDASDKTDGWKVKDITNAVEKNFKGAAAILLADNCYSGALAEAVKAIKKPKISYAALASTHYNSFSTGHWTFTESLIYAFRGDAYADDNRDGKVTFAELETNAAADMLFAEEQIAEFAYTPGFNKNGVIAAAQTNPAARTGERVEAYSVDGYYKGFILDAHGDQYKIRFYGYEETDDELVPADKIRRAVPKQYEIGERVSVELLGSQLIAKVIDVKGGSHLVEYEDYTADDDEWVPSRRIRELTEEEKQPKPLEFGIGDLVEAQDKRGVWYKSRIINITDGKYQIHFFGWDDNPWSELVSPKRVRISNDYDFGREVEVAQQGVWYQALIVDSRYGTEHLVAYADGRDDEWVKDERIRDPRTDWQGTRYARTVEIDSGKGWRRAQILKRRDREVYVHYENYDDVFNEWVSIDKIRRGR